MSGYMFDFSLYTPKAEFTLQAKQQKSVERISPSVVATSFNTIKPLACTHWERPTLAIMRPNLIF